jgi:hypothetical protein
MGSENADGCAQNAENGFGFDFLRVIPQRWRCIYHSHRQVTGDESWISFVNVETKVQSKQ